MKNAVYILIMIGLLLSACSENAEKSVPISTVSPERISELLTDLYQNTAVAEIREISAQEAHTLSFESGARLEIPENAFVNAKGESVKETVTVQFRKFDNPTDIILADIPMQYDSASTNYMFESAAMCEVLAFDSSGLPVFIKSGTEIGVTLNSHQENTRFNLYKLNRKSKKWEFCGKDRVEIIDTSASKSEPLVIPKESSPDKPFFSIVLDDKKRFPNYEQFNSIKFEYENSGVNPNEFASKNWIDFNITPNKKGTYTVTFLTYNDEVSFTGQPVFDGEDYKTAMQTYREKRKNMLREEKDKRKFLEEKGNIERAFKIDELGVWNCDAAVLKNFSEQLNLEFFDKKTKKPITVICAYAIWRAYNGNRQFNGNGAQVFMDKLSSDEPNELLVFFGEDRYAYFSERKVRELLKSQGNEVQNIYINPLSTNDLEPDLNYTETGEEEESAEISEAKTELKTSESDDLLVFPNPTRGTVTVKGVPEESDIVISDLNGRKIRVLKSENNTQMRLDLSDQTAGVYLITVISKELRKSERVVLQK